MMKRVDSRTAYLILLICFSIVLSGCGLDILEPATPNEVTDVEYIIVENGEIGLPLTGFNDLNPLLVDNIDYFYFNKLIFEGLFDYDSSIQPIPRLATTYMLSDDGKRVELYLREDVKWHNGETFDADDVVHTFNALISANSEGYLYKLLENTVRGPVDTGFMKLRKLSERSIEVEFKEPLSNWKDLLTFPIVPASTGSSVLLRDGYEPVGTGPFKFREYIKYKEVVIDSFADYWGGEPQISRISGKIFEDEELILTAFETGKLSMARSIGSDWDKYEHIERIRFLEYVSDEIELLVFNHNSEPFNLMESGYLKRAIMLGIDRQDIINKVLLQHGTQSDSPIHPQSYLFDPSTAQLGFSIDRMRQELSESGRYEINMETGRVMDIIDQEELTLDLLVNPESKTRKVIAERIREDLGNLGIGVNIVHPEPLKGETMDQAFLRMLQNGDYKIALVGFSVSAVPEFSSLLNTVGWNNSNVDQAEGFESYFGSSYSDWDEAAKFDNFSKLQRAFAYEIPAGSLFFLNRSLMVDNQISGPLEPNFYNLYNGLEKCFLTFSTD
jgi:peptide/nickel transport system substrate-binding protein